LRDLQECRVTPTFWSEPMRMVAETRLVISFQDGANNFLEEFIRPCWDLASTLPYLPNQLRNR
jgi:hypothetical protein